MNEETPITLAAKPLLDGPWCDPDEERPICRPAMYALAVAAHHLSGAIAQRQDCASRTIDEVERAIWWLDEFAKALRSGWKPENQPGREG